MVGHLQQENVQLRGKLRGGVAEVPLHHHHHHCQQQQQQQVYVQVERGMQELVLQYETKVGKLESQQRERLARPEKVLSSRPPPITFLKIVSTG